MQKCFNNSMKKIAFKILILSCGGLMTASLIGTNNYQKADALSMEYSTSIDTYYKKINATGENLLGDLHDLMIDTHQSYSTYDDCKNGEIIYNIEPGTDSTHVKDFYTQQNIVKDWTPNTVGAWNREHVWCQSLSIDIHTGKPLWGTNGGGSDLHHVRPIEYTLNSKRNNHPYGKVINGNKAYSKGFDKEYAYLGGYLDTTNDIFEPLNAVKGDVARILFYDYMHYSSYMYLDGATKDAVSSVCNTFGHLAITNIVNTPEKTEESAWKLLLEWNKLDPVSDDEKYRNNAVAKYQGNRNPFIDHPEYAELIWGEDTLDRTYKSDTITRESYGNGSGDTYTNFEVSGVNSGAKYSLNVSAASTNTKIKFNNDHAIYSSVSGGFIKQIKVEFNSGTSDNREILIRVSNVPFTPEKITTDECEGIELTDTIMYKRNDKYEFAENYKYVLLIVKSGDIYLDSIKFVWGDMNLSAATSETKTKSSLAMSYNYTPVENPKYTKITANLEDFSGKYLIVSSYNQTCLNASLAKNAIDVANNGVDLNEENGQISGSIENQNAYQFVIKKVLGGYSIYDEIGGYYIGHSGYGNALSTSDEPFINQIEIDKNGNAMIEIDGYILNYNKSSNNLRFRYYQTPSSQEAVWLYKLEEPTISFENVSLFMGAVIPFKDFETLKTNYDVTGLGVFVAVDSDLKGKTIRQIYRESNESVTSTTWMTQNKILHNARVVVDEESKLTVTRTDADGVSKNENGNYVTWKSKINISSTKYVTKISAVAYMIIDGEYCFFDQRGISVADIAEAYLQDGEYTEAATMALNYLKELESDE